MKTSLPSFPRMVLTSALKAPYPGKPGSDAELGQLVTLRTMEVCASLGPMTSMSNDDQIPAPPHSQVCPEDQTDDLDPIPVGKTMGTVR